MNEGYQPAYSKLNEEDRRLVHRALELLSATVIGQTMEDPKAVKNYLTLRYADLEHEVFGVLWLSHGHRIIAEDVLFRGTLASTTVYPREVVKQGLQRNAGATVLFHVHPSGRGDPSTADEMLTKQLVSALAMVDIRVLDHVVVAAGGSVSFAERGLL